MTLEIEFSKKHSSKKMKFSYDPNTEDLDTVFEQFALSLPGEVTYDEIHTVSMNGYKLNDQFSYNQIYTYLEQMNSNPVLFGDFLKCPQGLFIASKELTKRKLNSLFNNQSWTDYTINNCFYYITETGNTKTKTKENKTNEHNETIKPLSAITDFKELQKRALLLEGNLKRIEDGQKSVKRAMQNSSFDNFKINEALQKATEPNTKEQAMIDYLKEMYQGSFDDTGSKLQLINYLLNNWQNSDVQQVTLGKPTNLLAIVELIARKEV